MKIRHLLFLFLLSPCVAMAQAEGHKFNPQEMRAKMEAHIKQQAALTDDEAARFLPVFNEMREKQRALRDEAARLKREFKADGSDAEAKAAIARLSAIKKEGAQLEQTYMERLCKLVPAAKVMRVIVAEDVFHRDMLKRVGDRRRPQSISQPRQHRPQPKK